MKKWFISPSNNETVKAVMKLDEDTVFSRKKSFDKRGHLQEPVNMAPIAEKDLRFIHNSKDSLGLEYDTYLQESEGSAIKLTPFTPPLGRNEIPEEHRLADPFKQSRAKRKKLRLPKGVMPGSSLLKRA